jgi:hypothetical protein
MESGLKPDQLPAARNTEKHSLSPFAFPMMVLFGTYAAWIVVAGIILLVLNAF